MLIVKAKIKEATELNVGGDFVNALDEKVAELIKAAEERAKANGRKTVRAGDL